MPVVSVLQRLLYTTFAMASSSVLLVSLCPFLLMFAVEASVGGAMVPQG
jgi:hypothetical protein